MKRYEWLRWLYAALNPKIYLEVGVCMGWSVDIVPAGTIVIGVDPDPRPEGVFAFEKRGLNARLYRETSDDFFNSLLPASPLRGVGLNLPGWWIPRGPRGVDVAFIDGMHLAEFAMRDFINVEQVMSSSGVILLDDVLPYSREIATRTQPARGDWTGDVWKVYDFLREHRPDLELTLIDVEPTGLLAVTKPVDKMRSTVTKSTTTMWATYETHQDELELETAPPPEILSRQNALGPREALKKIVDDLRPE